MRLLSTKTLSPSIKDHLAKIGTSIVEYPLIKIQPLYLTNQKIQPMLIFTSQNAVRLVNKNNTLKNKIAGKKSFCVGEKTRELLKKFGFKVIEMKENANELAHFLVEKYNKNSWFNKHELTILKNRFPYNLYEINCNENFFSFLIFSRIN